MQKIISLAAVALVSILLFSLITGCIEQEEVDEQNLEQYRNCTAACAAVITDDFTTLHYCNEECKKFLEE
ncbi:MAG: hypothetical protein U9R34_03105 [Nanoarchaeota archaeon]|nr:hypothetical protein [Nanoarchaeota archaeon]